MSNKFWDLVFIDEWSPNACWLWLGPTSNGYGHFSNKRARRAHKFSFLLFGGIVTNEKPYVLHKCHEFGHVDNKLCVNPNHLRAGSDSENIQDCVKVGRHANARKTHCPQGHEYTLDNTYYRPSYEGKTRECRECKYIKNKIRYHKHRKPTSPPSSSSEVPPSADPTQ